MLKNRGRGPDRTCAWYPRRGGVG